jgi:6-phosphogluconolactonase
VELVQVGNSMTESIPSCHVQISANLDELARNAANFFAQVVNKTAQGQKQLLVALSGGSTPYPVYSLLADLPYREQIPWEKMDLFWVDERMVPENHDENNYHQAKIHLLNRVPLQKRNIHRIKSELPAYQAAMDYAAQLSSFVPQGRTLPVFDFIFLGLGEDGHTASLFPGEDQTKELEHAVIAVNKDYRGRPAGRVTFTPALINEARHICFLVHGKEKAGVVEKTIQGVFDPVRYPAQRIKPHDGEVVWMLDREAASCLVMNRTGDTDPGISK